MGGFDKCVSGKTPHESTKEVWFLGDQIAREVFIMELRGLCLRGKENALQGRW